MFNLYSHQLEAIEKMKNGCILCGDVGTGKSRTALAYFFLYICDGDIPINGHGSWREPTTPRDLYIITTAKKRDSGEWRLECTSFAFEHFGINVTIDSWNNIKKYEKISGAFFIFDEQRVSGWGAWSKTFLRITRKNQWVLLSATPGDDWKDYIPVFIANGFYKSKGEFETEHCIFVPYLDFPKIERYVRVAKLNKLRQSILVKMVYEKETVPVNHFVTCEYDRETYRLIMKDRWNPFTNEPIENVSQLCYILRKVVNLDLSRFHELLSIMETTPRAIIFYNFDYELEELRDYLNYTYYYWGSKVEPNGSSTGIYKSYTVAEWNGHKHDPVPDTDCWVYLVQYTAGCEGWNCITTDTMIFFSQSYSYRQTKQAAGRIDRLNTPFKELHYYYLSSKAPIDMAIRRCLLSKKNFNEKAFVSG